MDAYNTVKISYITEAQKLTLQKDIEDEKQQFDKDFQIYKSNSLAYAGLVLLGFILNVIFSGGELYLTEQLQLVRTLLVISLAICFVGVFMRSLIIYTRYLLVQKYIFLEKFIYAFPTDAGAVRDKRAFKIINSANKSIKRKKKFLKFMLVLKFEAIANVLIAISYFVFISVSAIAASKWLQGVN